MVRRSTRARLRLVLPIGCLGFASCVVLPARRSESAEEDDDENSIWRGLGRAA